MMSAPTLENASPHVLRSLPFAESALDPLRSTRSVELHHG